ncbi:MAG: IS1595 family transposase [Desulfoprunum sp.]|nr:IS1595 family transposase [Desulfoprunum sp.]
MAASHKLKADGFLANEHACVSYLFRKRWPWGFTCPFCGEVQKDIAPAYVVVCRYCRKQTSITAHTLMHGSKNSLMAWMQVARQFCLQSRGISARELQQLMGLSCYQTAWIWLQKIRRAAALAESAPCCGIVFFDIVSLPVVTAADKTTPDIGIALELKNCKETKKRVKFVVLETRSAEALTAAAKILIQPNTALMVRERDWPLRECLQESYLCGQPSVEQLEQGRLLLQETETWLATVFRGAIDSRYLQSYLDEFSFRCNTSFWTDRLAVLDHLLTGLVAFSARIGKTRQHQRDNEGRRV